MKTKLLFLIILILSINCDKYSEGRKLVKNLLKKHSKSILKIDKDINVLLVKFRANELKKAKLSVIGKQRPKPVLENSELKWDLNSRNIMVLEFENEYDSDNKRMLDFGQVRNNIVFRTHKKVNDKISLPTIYYQDGYFEKNIERLLATKFVLILKKDHLIKPKINSKGHFRSGRYKGTVYFYRLKDKKYLGGFKVLAKNSKSLKVSYWGEKTDKKVISSAKYEMIGDLQKNIRKNLIKKLKKAIPNIKVKIEEQKRYF